MLCHAGVAHCEICKHYQSTDKAFVKVPQNLLVVRAGSDVKAERLLGCSFVFTFLQIGR